MFVTILRTLILFTLVVVVVRLMGKRQVGELQPYELAVTVMISNLAAVPMEDTGIPLLYAIIPILLVFSLQVAMSVLSMKSIQARKIICGRPSVVVEKGRILEQELKRLRININDLLEQLRIAGYGNIDDIEFAVLETNGQFSVLPKSHKRSVQPGDLNLATAYEGLSYTLVIDGKVISENLVKVQRDEQWLRDELAAHGYMSIRDLFLVMIDSKGKLYCQKKEKTG